MKKSLTIVMSLFLCLLLMVGCSNQSTEQNPVAEQKGTENAETPQSSGSTHAIGDEVKVADLVYTVHSAKRTQSIGTDSNPRTTDQSFLVVEITIQNKGTETQLLDPSLFKLTDGAGQEFDPMMDGDMYVNPDTPLLLQDANPESQVRGYLVYEIPQDAAELQLVLKSGIGFEGDAEERILIGNPTQN